MNIRTLAAALAVIASVSSGAASAGAPACYPYNGQAYCQYTGKASRVYINSGGEILLYFDTPMPAGEPSSVGITGVTSFAATIFPMVQAPDYAKAMYATLLAAQARGATIEVQMWGTHGGYMKLDRVWILE